MLNIVDELALRYPTAGNIANIFLKIRQKKQPEVILLNSG